MAEERLPGNRTGKSLAKQLSARPCSAARLLQLHESEDSLRPNDIDEVSEVVLCLHLGSDVCSLLYNTEFSLCTLLTNVHQIGRPQVEHFIISLPSKLSDLMHDSLLASPKHCCTGSQACNAHTYVKTSILPEVAAYGCTLSCNAFCMMDACMLVRLHQAAARCACKQT